MEVGPLAMRYARLGFRAQGLGVSLRIQGLGSKDPKYKP